MTFGRTVGVSIQPVPGRRPLLLPLLLLLVLWGCEQAWPQQPEPLPRAAARPAPVIEPPASSPSAVSPPSPPAPSARTDAQHDEPAFGSGGGAYNPVWESRVRIAVLGDYGNAGPAEQQVAELVDDFQPDFVVTTGDNNYPLGQAETIDQNIGQYFSELIYPYKGSYGSSATHNRFFPTLGNHDWGTPGAQPYLDYFSLPGNERYYDVVWGNVHFFAIDSDVNEPDGIGPDSIQAQWLKRGLAASTSVFDVVAMHHPPYSSGSHGNQTALQWPYADWGAELVLAGHDHCYERIERDGITYVVSGLGGRSIYAFGLPVEGSVLRYNGQYGIALLEADARELSLAFFTVDHELIDSTKIEAR
jgi:hypothetical protein